ncbi:MAG: TerC family protein [Methylacidiphilales bacterium]|nr:TerC family protein [Candidatus Methylacidiphilales bacterium]
METPLSFWIGFNTAVVVLLILDLTVLHQEPRAISVRESLLTTLVWVLLASGFGLWIMSGDMGKGLEFFTGYLIEYSLSMDNVFIFVIVFGAFQVSPENQRRVLFWGVLSAFVMRGAMIGAGVKLLEHFEWIIYLFGAYILYAGFNMLRHKKKPAVEEMRAVRVARRILPISAGSYGGRFLVRENGRPKFTLLFLVLVVIEFTDLIFALDSIPAIFGVTRDPFIVYTSNVCAVLGLRSLYFLLAGAMKSMVYLHVGLAWVLIFIGAKMLSENFFPIPTGISLAVVGGILALAVGASLFKTAGKKDAVEKS